MLIEIQARGGSCIYSVPVMKVQNYSIEEILEKNLLFLIPFYLFSCEQYFPEYETDEKKLASLTAIYEGIAKELDEKANAGIIDEYIKLTIMDMSKKVLKHLAKKYSNIKKKVGAFMGGKILDYEAKDILNAGKAAGREEGIIAMIKMGEKHHVPEDEIIEQLMTDFGLDEKKAREYLG